MESKMQCLAGAYIICSIAMTVVFAMTGTSFAQRNNADELPISTWDLANKVNRDNHIDPIVTGETVTIDDMAEWEKRKKRFLDCGLCGEPQAFPE